MKILRSLLAALLLGTLPPALASAMLICTGSVPGADAACSVLPDAGDPK